MRNTYKVHRAGRRLWGLFFTALLLLSPLLPPAAAATPQVVRVGRFPYENQLSVDAAGNYGGYGYDYLQEIARYTGWRYEFVDAPWGECLDMLARGELDLMGAMMRSPERETLFDFSDLPMLSGYGALVTPLRNEELPYEEFSAFDGLRVGVLADNLQRENFLRYAQAHAFSPVLVEYTTQADMEAALAAGDVSAAVMTNLLHSPTLRVVASFGENDAYFATTKGNDAILSPLNEAMRKIRLADPYFNSKLDQTYYNLQASTLISFTREELSYIQSAPPIPCVYIPAAPPISYFDAEAQTAQGISMDICRLLESRTGLTFSWINAQSAAEAIDLLRRGEALLLPGKYHDTSWAQANGLLLTEPYLPGQMVMVTSPKAGSASVIAVYDDDSQGRLLADAVSGDARILQYPTIIDCMDAVLRGDANTTFVNSTVASYLVNQPQYAGLQTTPIYGYSADVGMAVSARANPLLLSVLNKGLLNISTTEINQVVLSQMKNGRAGALATYLYLHPVEMMLLLSGVFIALVVVLSVSLHNRKRNVKRLKNALYTDALSSFPNYSSLAQEAPALLGQHPEEFTLIYLDIHRFKTINDTFGYESGDQVLIATSHILNQFVASNERFARIYADTFVLLLRTATQADLQQRLLHLSTQLEGLSIRRFSSIKPLFRGGVYPLPREFSTLDKACDRANYAKSSITHPAANTFVFYDDVLRNRVLAEKELESSMTSALERGEFIPFYQPKVNAITEKVVGAEALVRWQHPEKGCLPPGEFLPFYEKNGFIVKIDLAIFEQVCRDIRQWMQAGNRAVPVSVNFSRRHMGNQCLPQTLKDIADRYEVPTSLLEVEITETEELESLDTALEFVDALKAFGFCISIDDYGTGYSSISFLQELPLDTLKLDQKFILNAMKSTKARDIMRHLVASMHQNKIRILCEGIETPQQREFVIGLNCRYIQGYLYSRPLPRTEFEEYLLCHGADMSEALDFIPITNFEERFWHGANDFLVQAIPSWIFCSTMEPGYPVQYISSNFLEDMGYSELEFQVATKGLYVSWVHPDDVAPALRLLEQRQTGDQDLVLQYRLRKKDGSYVWVREINKRVAAEDGRALLLSICTNISDLVELEAEKSRLVETIPGGVGELLFSDAGPIIQQGTDHFYEVLGHTPAEFAALGNNLIRIICPQDLPLAAETLQQILTGGKSSCECVFRIRQQDGRLHWITFRGTVSQKANQLLATVIVYNSDEEMLAKQAAEISRAKLELALALTEHAIFEYNIQSKTVYSHSGFSKYGIADGAAINVPRDLVSSGFVHQDDVEKMRAVQEQIIAGTSRVSYELRVRNRQASQGAAYLWVRITLTTIFDKDNQPAQAVGIVEDIGQQKHLEHAFQREAQYRNALTESSLMAYEFNLTRNTIGRLTGTRGFRLQALCDTLPHPDCYSDVLALATKALVVEADRPTFLRGASREALLQLYRDNVSETEVEYRRITPDGSQLWNTMLVYLVTDPLSGDAIGYAYHRDIHQRKVAEQTWMNQAARDSLTGLYNRSSGERLIQEALTRSTAPQGIQAFLMLDVDTFKEINDTCGHLLGDRLLMEIANVLLRHGGAAGIPVRMGGDEFALLLKNLPDREAARHIAEAIQQDVAAISKTLGMTLATSVSIGISQMPCHGRDFATLYRYADEAMYQAKRGEAPHLLMAECPDESQT